MKKMIVAFLFAVLPAITFASEGPHVDHADVNLHDQASLQRGARLFVNYCLSCHSAAFERYNRMGKDLGLSDEQVKANLMSTTEKVGEPMKVAMPPEEAKKWFGNPPPDLSVMARARGADYIYTYLRSFYVDDTRPFGVNNTVFPMVGMPHVLWELQGLRKPVYKTEKDAEGHDMEVITGFEQVTKGKMTPAEYDQAALDLTNFLVYLSEPSQLKRKSMGIWVLLFLGVLFIFAYALKKEYWKDVH